MSGGFDAISDVTSSVDWDCSPDWETHPQTHYASFINGRALCAKITIALSRKPFGKHGARYEFVETSYGNHVSLLLC